MTDPEFNPALRPVQPGPLANVDPRPWLRDHLPSAGVGALGLAADLHLASAVPGTDMVEYITGSPFIDEIVAEPWKLDDDGFLDIPSTPGLGVNLNLDAVNKFTGGANLL